jgi:hypothetical protein
MVQMPTVWFIFNAIGDSITFGTTFGITVGITFFAFCFPNKSQQPRGHFRRSQKNTKTPKKIKKCNQSPPAENRVDIPPLLTGYQYWPLPVRNRRLHRSFRQQNEIPHPT